MLYLILGDIMIKITLKDNSIIEVEKGTTIIELAKKSTRSLERVYFLETLTK